MPTFDHLNITHTTALPSPKDLMQKLPITSTQKQFVEKSRDQIRQIIKGNDQRLLLVMGPCSIHDITAAKEYAIKLRSLAQEVSDTFYIVMRTYFEKPRTARGWKGLLYDPWLNGSHDISTGLHWTRQLLLDLAEMEVPAAAELLDPASAYYFGDLISWGCIGARTAASQTHRQIASGLPMPVAFKNSTDGNVGIAINGILNAATSHTFIGASPTGQMSVVHTSGNPDGHLVLRGGKNAPNYDPQSIALAIERLQHAELSNRLLIDCSHDNASRKHEQQPQVFQSVIHQIVEGNNHICGLLLESHLLSGNQPLVAQNSSLKYAVSITDPCIDWSTTERLIRWGHALIKQEANSDVSRCFI